MAAGSADENDDRLIERFSNPYRRYRGKVTPQNLAFDANLQEFANRIGIICNLENAGKVSPHEAYTEIRELWQQLEASKENLLDPTDEPE